MRDHDEPDHRDAAKTECPFCALAPDRIWLQNEHAAAFFDAYPLTAGHVLVIPRRHLASIFDALPEERAALWNLVAEARAHLQRQFNPDGFTIGVNDGVAAGQTVPHGHVHIIPRRFGDVPDPAGGIRWIISQKAPYWLAGRSGATGRERDQAG